MKFRYVLAAVGSLLVAALLVSVGVVARSGPKRYEFLEGMQAQRVALDPDPIGLIGREVRYYLIDRSSRIVEQRARAELAPKGWKRLSASPVVFGRGPHERIEIFGPGQIRDDIHVAKSGPYTVVKVTDPRMAPAIKHRLEHWARRRVHPSAAIVY